MGYSKKPDVVKYVPPKETPEDKLGAPVTTTTPLSIPNASFEEQVGLEPNHVLGEDNSHG